MFPRNGIRDNLTNRVIKFIIFIDAFYTDCRHHSNKKHYYKSGMARSGSKEAKAAQIRYCISYRCGPFQQMVRTNNIIAVRLLVSGARVDITICHWPHTVGLILISYALFKKKHNN